MTISTAKNRKRTLSIRPCAKWTRTGGDSQFFPLKVENFAMQYLSNVIILNFYIFFKAKILNFSLGQVQSKHILIISYTVFNAYNAAKFQRPRNMAKSVIACFLSELFALSTF